MADEERKPLTDEKTGDEVKPTPEYTENEAERLPEPESAFEEAVDRAIDASEEAADSPVVEAFDEALTSIQDTIDKMDPLSEEGAVDIRHPEKRGAAPETVDHVGVHAHLLSDTTVVFGREITVPGGLYTVVFGFLAVATVVEILVGSLPSGILLIPLLLASAVRKAALVVAS